MLIYVIAGVLVLAALVCWIVAGRIELKRRIKNWNGEKSTINESQSARTWITVLRIGAGIFVVLAVVAVFVWSLLAAYAAT